MVISDYAFPLYTVTGTISDTFPKQHITFPDISYTLNQGNILLSYAVVETFFALYTISIRINIPLW